MFRISKTGKRKISIFRGCTSQLDELGIESNGLYYQDNNINALILIEMNLDELFDEDDYESDVSLFEITPSSKLENLIKVGLVEKCD